MKRYTLPLSLALALLSTAPAALAATSRLQNIQTKGNTDITERVTRLNTLLSKVDAAKKLTSDQKKSLTDDMQAQVTTMGTLKTKLDGETVVANAVTDFGKIFTDHYIYAFYVPRVERIVAADAESNAATNLSDLATKLDDYISTATAAGKDTSDLTVKIAEMKTKIADAQSQSATALTSLLPLASTGYPANKTIITAAATNLKTGRTSLEVARTDAKSIVASLKKLLPSS